MRGRMTAPDASDTLSIEKAARRLGISRGHAYRLAKEQGQLCDGLPVHRFGSTLKVSRLQLDQLLGAGEAKAS